MLSRLLAAHEGILVRAHEIAARAAHGARARSVACPGAQRCGGSRGALTGHAAPQKRGRSAGRSVAGSGPTRRTGVTCSCDKDGMRRGEQAASVDRLSLRIVEVDLGPAARYRSVVCPAELTTPPTR
jgi:hypothetical protein